jgi:precorrin-2 methylase
MDHTLPKRHQAPTTILPGVTSHKTVIVKFSTRLQFRKDVLPTSSGKEPHGVISQKTAIFKFYVYQLNMERKHRQASFSVLSS